MNGDETTHHVRMIGQADDSDQSEWIVLDSGADVSLLPSASLAGQHVDAPDLHLEDAQGKRLRIGGTRKAQLEFKHVFGVGDGLACGVCESFVLSAVTSTLLSFGRLLRTGWSFGQVSLDYQALVDGLHQGQCAGMLTLSLIHI